jgi:hypothetical protein
MPRPAALRRREKLAAEEDEATGQAVEIVGERVGRLTMA